MSQYVLSFAGAGRVSAALCQGFYIAGIKIDQICSRSAQSGKALAEKYNASWSPRLKFHDNNSIIIVAVPDSALKDVLSEIECHGNTIVAHTAGSFGLEVFSRNISKKGIFYPLQTFSTGRSIDFSGLPFFIESSDTEATKVLSKLAMSIGGTVHYTDTEHRKLLHLAAVFVCNFTNHMLTAGKEITSKGGLNFSILEPLIRETVEKAIENGPANSQTGPAIRNDLVTLKKHMELLSFSPDFKNIYKIVTESIKRYHEKGIK